MTFKEFEKMIKQLDKKSKNYHYADLVLMLNKKENKLSWQVLTGQWDIKFGFYLVARGKSRRNINDIYEEYAHLRSYFNIDSMEVIKID